MARRKKKPLPDIQHYLKAFPDEYKVRMFALREIPQAVAWAELGNIAIHENYHSRRRQSYHVICGQKDNLLRFCHKIGASVNEIKASEFYRFWHLTWFPPTDHNG
ncbi:MAG TPA: hypothetical protein EYP57_04800 [Thermodesulfobacteriaceae bacterium]|nr:hypothetical protein [Thermodesulfobacteriaceae bacterium]